MSGFPVEFEDGADYERSITGLLDTGILIDAGHITSVVRLSEKYPTIEVRIADAQLEVGHSVAFAVIVRALVERALHDTSNGAPEPRYARGLVNGATWVAARDGLETDLIDPLTVQRIPAFDLVARMLKTIESELSHFGDSDRVEQYVAQLRSGGHPGERQRAAYAAGGIDALLKLYQTVH